MARFRRAALTWFRHHRRDLPWRRTSDPYAILVSEVMLQQTQVDRVAPKFCLFLKRFPDLKSLAVAQLRDVLGVWSGLGYNVRARRLRETARAAVKRYRGELPRDSVTLCSLPGIGPYTGAAVASIAFGERIAAVDTNARRVLSRALGGANPLPTEECEELARRALPRIEPGEWNQALMDIGAIYCRARPRCEHCPLRQACQWTRASLARYRTRELRSRGQRPAVARSKFEGSPRYFRGRVIRALTQATTMSLRKLGPQVKEGFQVSDMPWLIDLLHGLKRDGLVALDERTSRVRLP